METLAQTWHDLAARVRRFVGSRVNDPHAADDLTQDVMLKVQSHLDSLPPEEKLPAWMMAVARNAVVDHYRAKAARERVTSIAPDVGFGPDDSREDASAAQGLAACLGRMVAQLPEPYRNALRLADLEGLSQQEVADRAGISLSGAKSRVQRGRQQLGEMIRDCCHVERDARGNVIDYRTTEHSARYCGDDHGRPRCGD